MQYQGCLRRAGISKLIIMKKLEITIGIAKLLKWNVSVTHDAVILEHPVEEYGFKDQHRLDVLDGSLGSKALCLDLLERFTVTYYPKRESGNEYRYGSVGSYARCGSLEPFESECTEKAICMAILKANPVQELNSNEE